MEDIFLTTAKTAALNAAKIHLSYFQKSYGVSFKDVHHNVVTDADIESEKSIVRTIRSEFPDHNFICEEGTYTKTDSPYTWIIDPLDGTVNFSRNIPHFCVSLALAYEETLIVGVVYDPVRKEMFSAVKGGGAFLGDRPVHVTETSDLKQALLYTGFYYDRGMEMKNTLRQIERFFLKGILGFRRTGTAALDLCYVACGRGEGVWEHKLSAWDTAASIVILREAGGRITDLTGTDLGVEDSPIVASNGHLHQTMIDVITRIIDSPNLHTGSYS